MLAHACACLSLSPFSDNADREERVDVVQGACSWDFARQLSLMQDNCVNVELC